MAKRRLNKNLVAFLTAAGIILAVVVVAIAAFNASRRDPAAIAAKAKVQEGAGDLERALDLYRRAYHINGEAKYLIEAARCAREMGELSEMFILLNTAHAQSPRDPEVLNALLTRYWEIRAYRLEQWRDVLDHAESMLELEPENLPVGARVLALVSKSEALERLKGQDPGNAAKAEATLRRAAEIDPTSPFVALVQAAQTRAHAEEQANKLAGAGRRSEAEALLEESRAARLEVLQPAVAAHPDDVAIRIALAEALAESGQRETSRACLEEGITRQPDDPELRFAMARFLLREVQREERDADEDQVRAFVDEGLRHIDKALELEPSLYQAYSVQANLKRLSWTQDGRWESDLLGCQKSILESYAAALRETVGLKTIRASLGRGQRLEMVARAFDAGLGFYYGGRSEAVKSQALTYVRLFHQEARTQYPEQALVALMGGHVALIDGDDRLAIKAFSEAEKRGDPRLTGRLAKEELVKLYRKVGELGLSLRYTDESIESYRTQRLLPPRRLFLHRAVLLIELDRSQEALDLLDSIVGTYPEDDDSRALRARALVLLERGDEATLELQELKPDDPHSLLLQARIAAYDKEYDAAATLLRQVLDGNPDSLPTIRLLMQVLVVAQRREEATEFIQERLAQTTDDRLRRVLQSYEVMLSEDDPEQRKQKLLEVIAQVPDEFERAGEYFNFWVAQQELERAVTYLDQMERLQEDNVAVLRLQFDTALRLQQCERAEAYASRLAQMNADRVGGAVFRGRHELSCGDPEKALSEFRAAEREFPTDSELKIRISQTLLQLRPPRFDEAIRTLERAVEFDPRNFPARKLLYICYEQVGRRQEGIAHLKVAANLNPQDAFIKERTELLEEEKDPQKGIDRRERLREKNPDDIANLLRLAELYERIDDDLHAEERLQAAARHTPADLQTARFAANFYAQRDKREAGEQLLQQHLAAAEGLGVVVARLLLSRFYEELGDREKADSAYQRAYQSAGDRFPPGSDDYRRAKVIAGSELAEFFRRNAEFFRRDQDYPQMIDAYREMIDAYRVVLTHLDPRNSASLSAARRSIIRGLLQIEQYGEAGQEIAAYRADFPKDPRGLKAEAELRMARNQLDQARELLSRVLEAYPDDAWSRYMLGRINMEQHRYTEARDELLRAKALAPEAFRLKHRLDLSRLYELTGQYGLAEAELRSLLPLQRPANDVEERLIKLLTNSGQVEEAQAFVNELRTRDPDQPFWHYQLGRLLSSREEYGAAVGPLKTAVDLTHGASPKVVEVVVGEWLLALTRGNRAREAIGAYEQLDARVVTPYIQACAAEAYLAEKQREVAVALLEQGVDVGSLHGVKEARLAVGRAITLLDREEGLALLRRVLEHAGNNPAADLVLRSTLARYLVAEDDPARRAEGLEMTKAVIAAATPGSPLHIEGLLTQGVAMEMAGQYEQVTRTYEHLLSLKPDNVRALNNLAYLLADKLDRPAEALQYAERVRDLAPDDANVLDTVGWVYFKNGRTEQAEAALLEALRIAPRNVVTRYHLGRIYADSGKRAFAERAFRRVLEFAGEQENAEYIQKAEEALEKLR